MELPVHTQLLRMERRIYQIGQMELPRPVSLPEGISFLSALALMLIVTRLLHIGISTSWVWVYLVAPWGVAWTASRPLADRKLVHLWLVSQLRYALVEPRLLLGLGRQHERTHMHLEVEVWQPRASAHEGGRR